MKLIKIFTEKIISNYKITLTVILILSLPLFYFFLHQKHYNDFNIYFDENDPDLITYKNFQKIYGNEQFVVVGFSEENLFTNENIDLIRKLTDGVRDIKGVQRIISLTEADEPVTSENKISFRKMIPPGKLTTGELEGLRHKFITNESMVKRLISKEGNTNLILIEIKDLEKADKTGMLKEIRRKTTEIAGNKAVLHFSGGPFAEMEMTRLSRKDFAMFSPIVFLIITVIIILLLKNFRLAVLCQSNLLLSVIWCVGFYVACGETFNIVSIVMVPVIMAISIADSVHILSHYKDRFVNFDDNHISAVTHSTQYVWLPCLFTSLTTAVGFFSFITGDVRPVKMVGIFTAIGVMMAFMLTVTFLPSMLVLGKKKLTRSLEKKSEDSVETVTVADTFFRFFLRKVGIFSTGYLKSIGIVFLLIMIGSIIGVYNLKFETKMLKNLPEDNKFRMDTVFIEKEIGGVMPFVLLVRTEGDKDFTHPEAVKFLNSLQEEIMRDVNQFSSFSSITGSIKQLNKVFNNNKEDFYRIPDKRDDIVEFYEMMKTDVLDSMLGPGYKEAKITFSSVIDSSEVAIKIAEKLDEYLKKKTGNEYSYNMTGRVPLAITMQKNLRSSQIKSFLMAFVIIFIMMFFVCRDFILSILCMIPNIFPISLTLGMMGWLDIPITVGTVMIASITIGIAVDDTIHFIVSIKRNAADDTNMKEVIKKSLMDVGKPIVLTSIILFCGFFTLILGNILPTKTFGVLTALAMLFALIGDIIVLPAMILLLKPKITPITDGKELGL